MTPELIQEHLTHYQPLTRHETEKLIRAVQRGGQGGAQAMEILIEKNMRLIVKTANKYRCQQSSTVTEDDIFQMATLGFMRAIQNFKFNHGTVLSTLAVIYMSRFIERGIDNEGKNIRIPIATAQRARRVNRVTNGSVLPAHQIKRRARVTEKQLHLIQRIPTVAFSIDETNTNDVVRDEMIHLPGHEVDTGADRHHLIEFLRRVLPCHDYRVYAMHFGFDPAITGGYTLQQIADKHSLSKERIRVRIKRCNDILRQPHNAQKMISLLNAAPQEMKI